MFRTSWFLLAATAIVSLAACGSHARTSTGIPGTVVSTQPTGDTTGIGNTTALQAVPFELLGHTWVPTSFISVGPLVEIPDALGASVVFDNDGTVRVDAGCYSGSGPVAFEGDQLTIGPIGPAAIACPQDVIEQYVAEQRILGLLQEPSYWSVDGDSLKIYPAHVTDSGIIFTAAVRLTPSADTAVTGETMATFQTNG